MALVPDTLTFDHILYKSAANVREILTSSRVFLSIFNWTKTTVDIANNTSFAISTGITLFIDINCRNPMKLTLVSNIPGTNTPQTYIVLINNRFFFTGALTSLTLTNPNPTSPNLDPIQCKIIYA